jgi:hypothetical protein
MNHNVIKMKNSNKKLNNSLLGVFMDELLVLLNYTLLNEYSTNSEGWF